jgi:8-oxo-dGTP pyrophosphatase MutT (NUDIX family)
MFSRLVHFIERHPALHRILLVVWRSFPPRMAGYLKGLLARNWLVGAAAVVLDVDRPIPEILLVQHSYRPKGSWGLPGGALESIDGDPARPRSDASRDDVIEEALRREVWEELGIEPKVVRLLRIDAIPYVPEEPGPYRLDFYYLCTPGQGFDLLRSEIVSGKFTSPSPEITEIRMVPLTELADYDLFSADKRFLSDDLPRLLPI